MPVNNDVLAALLANAQSREQPAAPRRRRRGGLAGIWDRNKNIIAPVVGAGLGALTGGLAAPAIAGGLMRGLDREGRGGVGFDVGRGVGGAVEGAAAGAAGRFGRGLLSRGPAGAGVAGIEPTARATGSMAQNAAFETGAQAVPPAVPSAVPLPTSRAGMQVSGGASGGGLMRGLGNVGSFVNRNANAVGMGLQGVSGIMGAQSERRIAEERMALERERDEQERRRRENIAGLLLPLYRQQAQRFTP